MANTDKYAADHAALKQFPVALEIIDTLCMAFMPRVRELEQKIKRGNLSEDQRQEYQTSVQAVNLALQYLEHVRKDDTPPATPEGA